jgi:hypothetical protein
MRSICRNVEVMWLIGRLAFDHKTIADFTCDMNFIGMQPLMTAMRAKPSPTPGSLSTEDQPVPALPSRTTRQCAASTFSHNQDPDRTRTYRGDTTSWRVC